jgi:UDP-N-acetylglucosamine 1-carboxyvinyltransferase
MATEDKLLKIGQFVSELREERFLTQKELAEKIGTTQSAIARIENGEQNISTKLLTKISKALKREVVVVGDKSINLRIDGGRKLSGSIKTNTSKNAAVVLLCASLLNKGKTTLKNVSRIEEVYRIIEVLKSIGVSVKWDENDVVLEPKKINLKNLDFYSASRTRSVILFISPLIHFFKKFKLPHAGGCILGARTVRPHFFALEKFGVKINSTNKEYEVNVGELKSNEIILYESGDTVTENAIMAASLIPGETTIKFASANYQVQDLCFFLEKCGVKIEGIGTTTLTISGLKEINKNIEYYISEDPIESMLFLAVAIVTNSTITITHCPIDFLSLELLKLEKMGFKYKILKEYKALNGRTKLVDIKTFPSKLYALPEKIESRPYPGLNADNLPFFTIIATQAKGQTLIHDWMYEKRAVYYKDLDKLGADTVLADPHRLFVIGPTPLQSTEVICPPALRPGAVILVGMIGAKGQSIIRNVYNINRGYENLVNRLNKIGAKISVFY